MKNKVYIYIALLTGLLNIVFFQNCAKQVFDRPENKVNPSPQACQFNFSTASIIINPNSNYQINQDIRFSVDSQFFESINWEFYRDSNRNNIAEEAELIHSLSSTQGQTTVSFSNYDRYIIVAALSKTDSNNVPCSKVLRTSIDIIDTTLPPVGACLETSSTQNGSLSLPWKVTSCECFQAIETNPKNSLKSHYFKIENDLDCSSVSNQDSGLGFKAITSFNGHIIGNNKKISNLKSLRDNASVFFKDLAGSIKNVTFDNLHLASQNTNAAFHMIDRTQGFYTNWQVQVENVKLQNIYVEGSDYASGFSEKLLGTVKNLKVTGSIKAKSTSGITRELYALRLDFANENQASVIEDSEFSGTLIGSLNNAGLALTNFGLIKNSKAIISVNQRQQNLQFGFGGISHTNCAGGRIENSESNGTVNLDYSITLPAPYSLLNYYGSLVATNTFCYGQNRNFDSIPGEVINSRSTISATVRITRSIGATAEIRSYINNLIGYDVGQSSGNVFNGQLVQP